MARLEPAGNPQLRAVAGFRDEEASDLSSAHVTGRLIALGLVILLHALMIYGLANLLSRRRVEVPSLAVTARIIAAVAPERPVAGPADTPVAPAPEVAQPPALKPAAAPVRAPPRASRAAPTRPAEDAAPQLRDHRPAACSRCLADARVGANRAAHRSCAQPRASLSRDLTPAWRAGVSGARGAGRSRGPGGANEIAAVERLRSARPRRARRSGKRISLRSRHDRRSAAPMWYSFKFNWKLQ